MAVTLRVSSHQSRTLGADAIRVFHEGGTIGRTPGNDWVLPDPERFVSGEHAVIALEDGAYMLTDRSTNGTVVNGRELPQGGRVRLSNGDQLTIGPYEISVSVAAESGARPAAAASPTPPPAPQTGEPFGQPSSVDPLDFFSDPGPSAVPPGTRAGAEPDHVSPEAEYFPPPSVRPEAPAQVQPRPRAERARPASDGGFIPEDWDATGFSMAGEESAGPDAGDNDFFGAPSPPADGPGRAEPFDAFDAPRTGGHAEPLDRGSYSDARTPPRPSSPNGPPAGATATHPQAVAPRAVLEVPAHEAGSVDALLRAAGLDPAAVDEETLASLGEILRVAVEGLMDVLRARAALKNQFRVAMTTLKPVENNPLKFSANADDALFNLFARRGQSFKAPVDAFREAFGDLKAHQIAMMAGMRAAFGSLLKRFDPEELQTAFDRGLRRAAILDVINKTKYWELYREMYRELGDDDATFRRLFGDEFAQAYEEQMQRLTALHKQ